MEYRNWFEYARRKLEFFSRVDNIHEFDLDSDTLGEVLHVTDLAVFELSQIVQIGLSFEVYFDYRERETRNRPREFVDVVYPA